MLGRGRGCRGGRGDCGVLLVVSWRSPGGLLVVSWWSPGRLMVVSWWSRWYFGPKKMLGGLFNTGFVHTTCGGSDAT